MGRKAAPGQRASRAHRSRRVPGVDLPVGLALLTVYGVWGSTYLGIHLALEGFPPFLLGAGRSLVAGGLLYAFLRLRGQQGPTAQEWKGAAVVGLLLLVGGNGFVTYAQQWVPSGLASMVMATVPLWATTFSGLGGHRPRRWEVVGLVVGFAGVGMLQWDGGQGHPWGIAALLLAAVVWAAGTTLSPRVRQPSGWMASATQMLVGGERMGDTIPGRAWVAALYLTACGSLLGFGAYAYLVRRVRPSLATSYAYVNPLVAVTLGALVLGERVSVWGVGGMVAILTGVAGVLVGGREAKKGQLAPTGAAEAGGGE